MSSYIQDLEAGVARLTSERDAALNDKRLADGAYAIADTNLKLAEATIARLTADLAEARKDGERLDWLAGRTGAHDHWKDIRVTDSGITALGIHEWQPSLRAAIDAARDAGKGANL